jgi:ribosomal protein S18 acetylase RimI-like enzyme
MIRSALAKGLIHLFLANINYKPVGVALLFLNGHISSIHMMAVIPEYRRRHVATTILLELLHFSKNSNCQLIWLRTKKGGIGEQVYIRNGFRSLFDILTYTKTPNLES